MTIIDYYKLYPGNFSIFNETTLAGHLSVLTHLTKVYTQYEVRKCVIYNDKSSKIQINIKHNKV